MLCLLACIGMYLQQAAGIATSHQSFSSGDGWRYSYGIVHGPHGVGHAEGESYPHGYGGFGTYAPTYGYDGFGLVHHHEAPHGIHHEIPHEVHHEVPHVLPVPAVHAPLPAVHAIEQFPSYHGTPLPYSYPYKGEAVLAYGYPHKEEGALSYGYPHKGEAALSYGYPYKGDAVKFLEPIKAIQTLPHALPHAEGKPFSAPEYVLPSYQAGQYYGSGYLGDYSDLFSHYFNNNDDHLLSNFRGFEDVVLPEHGLYGDYLDDHYKSLYKPNYNDYYGSTSYHH
ncbi:unnamed protein product [Nezara viridula]|uniref:Neuropeptide n=1 Tax=Nezara viridula TaxID=85310 RepID=A0A9P0HHN1_NEZVI|nr:unnamed protein product [Nezara viridula]